MVTKKAGSRTIRETLDSLPLGACTHFSDETVITPSESERIITIRLLVQESVKTDRSKSKTQ